MDDNALRMGLRQKYHAAAAKQEPLFAKLRPLRAAQAEIRKKIAELEASEVDIVTEIHQHEAVLAPVREEMSKAVRALRLLDNTPTPSVGLAPDGRDSAAA